MRNPYIAAMFAMLGVFPEPLEDKYIRSPKTYTCKKCGQQFKPTSTQKTEYCSVECFRTRKASEANNE